MNYFICYEWDSTRGNHAGMVHLCKLIHTIDIIGTKVYVISDANMPMFIRVLSRVFSYKPHKLYLIWIALQIAIVAPKCSRVFLMEYFHIPIGQVWAAKVIKYIRKDIEVSGLAHLVPSQLDEMYSDDVFRQWATVVDKVLTLGNSLTDYLIKRGVNKEHVRTLFHYVDGEYYQRTTQLSNIQSDFSVIFMGAMARDYDMLYEVVLSTPEVHYNLCLGNNTIKERFKVLNNVTIYGYVEEGGLRDIMNASHVSFNPMYDTIGSNVITTSLAMGLAMVVSDVGSIRDYCKDKNTLFCNSKDDFVQAIQLLHNNRKLCAQMQQEALNASRKLSVAKFYASLTE